MKLLSKAYLILLVWLMPIALTAPTSSTDRYKPGDPIIILNEMMNDPNGFSQLGIDGVLRTFTPKDGIWAVYDYRQLNPHQIEYFLNETGLASTTYLYAGVDGRGVTDLILLENIDQDILSGPPISVAPTATFPKTAKVEDGQPLVFCSEVTCYYGWHCTDVDLNTYETCYSCNIPYGTTRGRCSVQRNAASQPYQCSGNSHSNC